MPKPLSEQDKKKVIEGYLRGSSYRDIVASTNTSLGSVSTILNEAKSIYPDLEQLRELRSQLPQNVDIPTLNKAITTVLEAQRQLGISIEKIPEYIEARKKEIGELSEQKESLKNEVSELTSKRESLQSEVKELSDRKAQLGNDIQEYEDVRKHLAEYGIDVKDIGRLRKLLDSINEYALDTEKCVSVIEEHESLFKEIQGIRSELDELTMFRDALRFSLSSLEYQHAQASLKLGLKMKAIERREAEVGELDRSISQLKVEAEKLHDRKEAIIAETSAEREKRQRMLEAYKAERDNLKSEVDSLKVEINELNKMIDERSKQIEELDEQVKHLKKSIDYYEQSKTIKEIETELDIAKLRFFNLTAKAIEREDYRFFQSVIDNVLQRISNIEEKLGIKRESNIIALKR